MAEGVRCVILGPAHRFDYKSLNVASNVTATCGNMGE